MARLNLFAKRAPTLLRLPEGSFTVDREGRVLVSTVPQHFPPALIEQLAGLVVTAFRQAEAARFPLDELILNYSSLKITARALRGGALVFLTPQTPITPTP